MAWYDTGTVAVTNGSTTVTGTGTNFVAGAQVGEGFLGPDGKLYEIASITSATALVLADGYLGSTQSGQAYKIVPTQSLVATLASQVSTLITDYQNTSDGIITILKAGDGAVGTPSISFNSDQDTGFYHDTANEIAVSIGGVKKAEFNSVGLDVTGTATVDGLTVDNGGVKLATGSQNIIFDDASDITAHEGGGIEFQNSAAIRFAGIKPYYESSASGNGTSLLFYTNANASAPVERVRITAGGDLAINTAGWGGDITNYRVTAIGTDPTTSAIASINTATSSATQGGGIVVGHDDGAALASTHRLGGLYFAGTYDATHTLNNAASLEAYAASNWAAGSTGAYLDVSVAPIGSATRTKRARFSSNGDVKFAEGSALDNLPSTFTTTSTAQGMVYDGANGFLVISRTGTVSVSQPALHLNRSGTNGQILSLKKDGSAVGELSYDTGLILRSENEFILFDAGGSASQRLIFQDDGASARAFRPTTGQNNNYDLGSNSARWKTIYANSIRLGGSGTANELDDYEEGTWTPTYIANRGLNGTGITGTVGRYVKVGETVTCTVGFASNSTGAVAAGDYFQLSALPFAPFAGTVGAGTGTGLIGHLGSGFIYTNVGSGANAGLTAVMTTASSNVYLIVHSIADTAPDEGDDWTATFTYRTNA